MSWYGMLSKYMVFIHSINIYCATIWIYNGKNNRCAFKKTASNRWNLFNLLNIIKSHYNYTIITASFFPRRNIKFIL